jgi:hypothetical protein
MERRMAFLTPNRITRRAPFSSAFVTPARHSNRPHAMRLCESRSKISGAADQARTEPRLSPLTTTMKFARSHCVSVRYGSHSARSAGFLTELLEAQ